MAAEVLFQRANLALDARLRDVEESENRMRGLASQISTPMQANITALQGACDALQTAITAINAAMTALATHTHAMSDITGLSDALAAKANTVHSHVIADVTGLQTELNKRPQIYQGATQRSNVKMVCKTAVTTTGGIATYYLTDNALVGGNALFTSVFDETIDFEVNDSANSYRYAWTLSVDMKTLTATVTRQAPVTVLGIPVLGALNPTPNGTGVRVTLWGN